MADDDNLVGALVVNLHQAQEMADNEGARPVPDTHSSLADGFGARMGRAPGRGTQSHESGPGLQPNDGRARAIFFRDIDTEFMVVRRFALLHSRALLQLENDIAEIEDRMMRLDGNANDQLPSPTLGQGLAPRESWKWLLAKIDEKLSDYGELMKETNPDHHAEQARQIR